MSKISKCNAQMKLLALESIKYHFSFHVNFPSQFLLSPPRNALSTPLALPPLWLPKPNWKLCSFWFWFFSFERSTPSPWVTGSGTPTPSSWAWFTLFFLRRLRPQQLHVHGSHDCRARDDDEVDFTEDRFSSFNVVVGYFGQANCMNDGCRYA